MTIVRIGPSRLATLGGQGLGSYLEQRPRKHPRSPLKLPIILIVMFAALIDSPAILGISIITLAFFNYGLGLWALRTLLQQDAFEFAEETHAERGSSALKRQMSLPFVTAVPIAVVAMYSDPIARELLCGGYLVMQLATLVLNLDRCLVARVLAVPGMAQGHIRLSLEYRHRSAASHIVALALFCAAVAVFFESPAFAAGSVLLLATAVGWYRRARQVSQRLRAHRAEAAAQV